MSKSGRRSAEPVRYGKSSHDDWIEDRGVVVRLLNDDREEDGHQRFVVRLASGQTLLVAHNVTLAERVPLGVGDRVSFRGVYEWNEQGGLVHWTHRDPLGSDEAGFIRFRDTVYA